MTWSGRALKRMEVSSALIPTLLPEPVVPAISRCGMPRRSSTTGSPWMSLPSASVRSDGELWNFSDSIDVAQRDDLAAARVGHLDADARAARQPLDADRLGREREREVLGEAHDLVDLDAGGGPELVRRDDRARVVLGDLALDAELGALRRDRPAGLGEQLPVHDPAGLCASRAAELGG